MMLINMIYATAMPLLLSLFHVATRDAAMLSIFATSLRHAAFAADTPLPSRHYAADCRFSAFAMMPLTIFARFAMPLRHTLMSLTLRR